MGSTVTRRLTGLAVVALVACGCAPPDAIGENGLPRQLVWSTYGTGTSTYADVAAVAGAVTGDLDTPVRILTSDTAIGRLAPLRQGPAQFSRVGDEHIFAYEGDHDFTSERWGPQDLRVVWAPQAPHGLLVRADSGIETFADLRGADFPRLIANPSVNEKLEAFLAYGGLTLDDVNLVDISYGDQAGALQSGQLDVLFQQVYGASLYELEAAFDVRWLSMADRSPEGLQRVLDIVPSVDLGEFSGAPGQAEGERDTTMIYAVPMVAYADTDPDVVYRMVRSIVGTYEQYEGTTRTTPEWSAEAVLRAPKQVPFHEGTVRLLAERGLWTAEAEALNQALIARGEELRARWPRALEADDPRDVWAGLKADVPAPEPIVEDEVVAGDVAPAGGPR